MRSRDAQCWKNRSNESTANSATWGGENVCYKIVGYKNGKKLGSMRDHTGKVLVFRTKLEAETTANIESLQIENIGVKTKVVRIKSKAGEQ